MTNPRESSLSNDRRMEQFLRKYRQLHGLDSASYAEYLRTSGTDPDKLLGGTLASVYRTAARNKATYGVSGESLARRGTDGYAAYLGDAATRSLSIEQRKARSAHSAAVEENRQGYASYIEGRTSTLRTTINSMRAQHLSNREDAYAYALAAGLNEEEAQLAADLIEGMEAPPLGNAEMTLRTEVLERMVDLALPRDAAYNYALSCGLSASAAAELADSCEYTLNRRNNSFY